MLPLVGTTNPCKPQGRASYCSFRKSLLILVTCTPLVVDFYRSCLQCAAPPTSRSFQVLGEYLAERFHLFHDLNGLKFIFTSHADITGTRQHEVITALIITGGLPPLQIERCTTANHPKGYDLPQRPLMSLIIPPSQPFGNV